METEVNKMLRSEIEIMKNWKGDKGIPLLSICCTTYNHENYIVEALDSFLMQETNFCFEIIVRDDASQDSTADIINRYLGLFPNIIKPIYEITNQYSEGVKPMPVIFEKASGEYLALCEGDDYWVDKDKLQKQVDFLEEHHDYGLIYTKANVYIQEKEKYAKKTFGVDIPLKGIVFNNPIPTLTVVCRRSLVLRYLGEVEDCSQTWKMGDYPMWIWFDLNSRIFFLKEVSSVYRLSGNSMSQRNDGKKRLLFLENSFDIANFFAKKALSDIDYNDFLIVKYLGLYNASIKANTIHYKSYLLKLNNIKDKDWKVQAYLFILEVFQLRKLLTLFFKFKQH